MIKFEPEIFTFKRDVDQTRPKNWSFSIQKFCSGTFDITKFFLFERVHQGAGHDFAFFSKVPFYA